MPYLVFDTETTGLIKFDMPDEWPGQPRLASFAMLFVNDELQLTEVHHGLVKPDGWEMPDEATAINGLTTERLMEGGRDIRLPLHLFAAALMEPRTLVAHNLMFDKRILRSEMCRLDWPEGRESIPGLCTMLALTPICAIPNPKGAGFKWPRLSEAYKFVTGRELENAHGALPDALACLELLRFLKAKDMLPVAQEAA